MVAAAFGLRVLTGRLAGGEVGWTPSLTNCGEVRSGVHPTSLPARTIDLHFETAGGGLAPARSVVLHGQRDRDGGLVLEIRDGGADGYWIGGPPYGGNLLARDGRSVRCRLGTGGEAAWLRLFVAQVLPFAAVLQGLEVLHASAVVHDGRAIGITAGSGGGKSTLAAALRERGDAFLADDVLALEPGAASLLAHRGPPLVGVPGDREALAPVAPGPGAAPLGALFVLDRRRGGPGVPAFAPAADPRLLLTAGFNTVLRPPARLAAQLEVAARAAAGRVERVRVDPAVPAATVAAAIHARLGRTP